MTFNFENIFKRPKNEQINQDESTDISTHELANKEIEILEKEENDEENPEKN